MSGETQPWSGGVRSAQWRCLFAYEFGVSGVRPDFAVHRLSTVKGVVAGKDAGWI
jgi:hypothetical protein